MNEELKNQLTQFLEKALEVANKGRIAIHQRPTR